MSQTLQISAGMRSGPLVRTKFSIARAMSAAGTVDPLAKEALAPTPVSVSFTFTPFNTACSGSVRETLVCATSVFACRSPLIRVYFSAVAPP